MAAPQRLVLELSAGCQLWLFKPWNTDAERTRRPNIILWYFSLRRIVRDVQVDGSRGITAIIRQILSTASHIWKRSGSEDLDDTQAAFLPFEQLWEGGAFKFLGSGIYYKKILFISVQVYAVALYVEADKAKAELQRLRAEGFFAKGYSDDRVMGALVAGRFRKLLQIQMLRSASVSQFDNEISKDLKPRLARTGDEDLLQPFLDYFEGKSFEVGTSLLALWEEDGRLTGGLFPPGFTDFADAKVSIGLGSGNFSAALFDMYIGPQSIVPDGRQQFVEDTLQLLKVRSNVYRRACTLPAPTS